MHVSNQCRLAQKAYGPDVRNVVAGIWPFSLFPQFALLNDDVPVVLQTLPISTLQPRSLSQMHAPAREHRRIAES